MKNIFKKKSSQQNIFFIFFIISTISILILGSMSTYALIWRNKQLERDAGAIGRIGFSKELSEDERAFIRNSLKDIPFSEQKSFAGTVMQDGNYLLTEIDIIYDPYPLTQQKIKLKDDIVYINQPLQNKLAHMDYISIGLKEFKKIEKMDQTFYWTPTELVWPVVWITPKTAKEIGLLGIGGRYQDYFYVNTTKLPDQLQEYIDATESSFDLYSDQKNIISDLVKLTKYCSDWFFISLVFIQTIALWLLLINYQQSEKARVFFINWFQLKWPYRHFLLKKSFILFSILTICTSLILKFSFKDLDAIATMIFGQYIFISSILFIMSLPIFFNKNRFSSFFISMICSFIWAYQLNPSQETWSYSMLFLMMGFMITMLVLILFGYLARISKKFTFSILGRFWSRKAFDESWPISGLISCLILSIVGIHLLLSFSNIIHQPLNNKQPNLFGINLPLSFDKKVININSLEEYKICRPKLITIDGIHVKQTKTESTPGREGIYRPLNATALNKPPHDNIILEGTWPAVSTNSMIPLLIDNSFAKKLNIKMNSILEFDFGDQIIKGQVRAIQQAQWESMSPNFFVIFPENTVSSYFESTMIATHIAEEKKSDFIVDLIINYPSTTIFDVDGVKIIAKQWIDPLVKWIYAVSIAFFFSLFLFALFIKKLYPTEFLPTELEKTMTIDGKKTYSSIVFHIKNIILTSFVMLSCLCIFVFGQWTWLSSSTLIYSCFSLMMSTLFCFSLLSLLG